MSRAIRNALDRSTAASGPSRFTGVKVFCATVSEQREKLGERISTWLGESRTIRVVDKVVLQSSGQGFHCLSIMLFYVGGDPE